MKKLLDALRSGKTLVSDGAWGTMLYEKGLKAGECPELWNATNPDKVREVAAAYIEAGSDMIETNSFGGNRLKLAQYNLADRAFELNEAAARISREAAGEDRFVLGSIGPTGKFLMMGDVTEQELYDSFKEQALAFEKGGADAVVVETFYAIDEAETAIKAIKENTDFEVACTFTFEPQQDGSFKTMTGVSPEDMVRATLAAGADVVGTNCGNGFEKMVEIIASIRAAAGDTPILVHANAGMPQAEGDRVVYPETPEFVAKVVPKMVEAGANVVGGCCGTTPAHVKALKAALGR